MENKIYDLPKGLKSKYVFLENDFPIFFSCTDDNNNNYLGCFAAVEDNNLKFSISKVTAGIILKVLMNKIYLYDAFKTSNINFIITLKPNEITEAVHVTQLEDKYLPVKEEYLDAELDEFLEEKRFYSLDIFNEQLQNFSHMSKIILTVFSQDHGQTSFINNWKPSAATNVIDYKEFKLEQLGGLNATKSA